MSNKPEVERAAEVMRKVAITDFAGYAAAISAAGLLRTDADAKNESVLVALAQCGVRLGQHPQHEAAYARGAAILDARKPLWTVERKGPGLEYRALCSDGLNHRTFPADAEPEARAYVARKNAEGSK